MSDLSDMGIVEAGERAQVSTIADLLRTAEESGTEEYITEAVIDCPTIPNRVLFRAAEQVQEDRGGDA